MLRTTLLGVIVMVALVMGLWLAGTMLPIAHEATRSAAFNAPPEEVYRVIAARDRYREWWDDDTPTIVVESTPPRRLVTRTVEGLPFGGTWTFEVHQAGSGSRVTITERGQVYNPFFRVLSRYVFGHTATMDSYLTALATRLAETQ